jgi:1-acyl-sn-glycerol-3-phosphate acyltransferase
MKAIASFIYYRLLGWTLEGSFPNVDKCVVIVVPHTHWVDFFLGLLIRRVIDTDIHFIGKKSLFEGPFGWFFRWMGGTPVERAKSSDTVQAIADIFRERKEFRLALSHEGTRKKVERWRTGFYYIALEAGVPIVPVAFDFGKKQIKIAPPMMPTGDFEADYALFRQFYEGVQGYVPEYT